MIGIYKLPPRFYDDHVERDCAAGVLLRRTKSAVYVDLDQEGFDDLHSDAEYYGGMEPESGFGLDAYERAIISSARATLTALNRGPIDKVPAAAAPRKPTVVNETKGLYAKPCEVCGNKTHRWLVATGEPTTAACLGHRDQVASRLLGAPSERVAARKWKKAK